ncbi:MAG: hypothetical protein RBS58_06510 [Syntrophales bacterium]|nr:hypothetical protein [Syntrophales bacterium]
MKHHPFLPVRAPIHRDIPRPCTEEVARECLAGTISDFLLFPELLASFGRLGYDVVEMVLADQDSWDRYEASKWLTMRRWLEANPDDEFAKDVRAELTSGPERYAAYAREYLGWGVFALMRGLPGDSESGENPIMPNNSFKPMPLRARFNSGVMPRIDQ